MTLFFDVDVFFYNPVNVYITIAAVSLSLFFFLLLKFNLHASNRQKLILSYAHVFALVFPVIYFMYSTGCRMLFSSCHKLTAIIYLGMMAFISALITAMLVAPFFLLGRMKKRSMALGSRQLLAFVRSHASRLGIRNLSVYVLKTAKPLAFTFSHFSRSIFISAGMADLLSKRELESVLLHELAHVRDSSPSLKITQFVLRIFSPLAKYASFGREIDEEEAKADSFSIQMQGTQRYIRSARKKIGEFYDFKS
jgi:Zn-dependent protease with chaperone function